MMSVVRSMLVVALGLTGAAITTPRANAKPPDSVAVEVIRDHWNGWLGQHARETTLVHVRAGQALPGAPHGSRRDGTPLAPAFTVSRIEASDRIWVRPQEVIPRHAIGGLEWEEAHDSVLVTTSRRRFGTPTKDAGTDFFVRVVSPRVQSYRPDPRVAIRVRDSGQLMGVGMWPSRSLVQGLFRLLEVHRDTLGSPDPRRPRQVVAGRFRAVERWGLQWSPPDTELTVVWDVRDFGLRGPEQLDLILGTRPGRLVVLRASQRPWDPVWRGFPDESFAVVDSVHQMIWEGDFPYRYLHELRDEVRASCWPFEHPWLTRLVGHVETAAPARSGPPVRVRLRGSPIESIADSTGAFDLTGLPIGHRELEFRQGKRSWRALVELSDERLDTLEVVLR